MHQPAVRNLSFAHFIARRIFSDQDRRDRLSRPIVSIAIVGIILGMAVMIVTVAVTRGFQREIRAKVIGAGGHIQITSIGMTDPKETPRTERERSFLPDLAHEPGIAHVQIYATKPGIIETGTDIQGVIVKGIGPDADTSYFSRHLLEGRMPDVRSTELRNEVLLSKYLADRLRIGIGDPITIYLIKGREEIRPRKFSVVGIYRTGLEQVDEQLVLIAIGHIQRFSQWGLQAEIRVADTVVNGTVQVEGLAFGGDRVYDFEWPGHEFHGPGPHQVPLMPDAPVELSLVVHDDDRTLPDTAWVRLSAAGVRFAPIHSQGGGELIVDSLVVERGGSGGSHDRYTGGFEVALERFADLEAMDDLIYTKYLDPDLRTTTVKERHPEIFAWLELLDTNVVVIIILMVLVAVINMISALLIIILERTRMIGVLKALGASNGTVQRIFLLNGAYILLIGLVLGNLLGLLLLLVQRHTGLVRLPVESYYLSEVPVDLSPLPILALNAGTLLVCILFLVLPTLLVSRIAPAQAVRFQ
ncbi:MAG: ABC transporter permease [Flavobacteriales bacterium]|nr:ABC transporter permease [Flavobacteriales bacterium]